jgi:hypothetical protein
VKVVRGLRVFALVGAAALAGCQLPPATGEATPPPASSVQVGSIALRLSLGDTYEFATLSYDISGNGFHATADVDVRNSRTFTATVGNIPFGRGYEVRLTARETSGKLEPCSGTATFDVTTANPVPVTVGLTCREVAPPAVPVPPGAIAALAVLLGALGAGRIGGRRRKDATFAALFAALASASLACQPAPEHADLDLGDVGLALQLAPGTSVNRVAWTITGPNMFNRAGDIDVGHSTTIGALIPGLPPGMGYSIALSSTTTDGLTLCAGAAPFAVTAGARTPVTVNLVCEEPARSGSVVIEGVLNICPVALTAYATVNGTTSGVFLLGADARDADEGPTTLKYSWTVSEGATLNDAHLAAPTLTCSPHADIVDVTVTVDDGDCADSATIQVGCPP